MQAGWNLLVRYTRSEGEFYKKMLIITLLAGFLPAVLSEIRTGSMTPLAWACVIGSGISAAFYLFGPAKAFSASDFTDRLPGSARSIYRNHRCHPGEIPDPGWLDGNNPGGDGQCADAKKKFLGFPVEELS